MLEGFYLGVTCLASSKVLIYNIIKYAYDFLSDYET